MTTTLKWWFLFSASVLGFGLASWLGFTRLLWDIDATKISFIIIGLYFLISPFVGWMTWKQEQHLHDWQLRREAVPQLIRHMGSIEEACDLMMKLAIMGTTLGFFIVITSVFSGGVTITQQSIANALQGLGLIYLVTFVGVVCSSLLSLQLTNLRYVVDES